MDVPGMSNFRQIDRDTGFLLPPSIDEWLPQRHLARFVVEVIDGLDVSTMSKRYRGSGSASYHPSLLLGILVYGYATGVFSSRNGLLRRHNSVMLSSPRRPDSTMRIFSSAEYCLRVCRRISRTACSAPDFGEMDFCLIFVPFGHYDEPEILRSVNAVFCPTGADVRQ